MAEKKALCNYAGEVKELQAGDTLAGAGSSSPLTTKGDIYTYAAADERLAVGTDGQILSADSGEATGLKWITSPAGYTIPFDNDNLSSGILTVAHNLGATTCHVSVRDNNKKLIIPDDVTFTDGNNLSIDLSAYGAISGTWEVTVGVGGTGDGNYRLVERKTLTDTSSFTFSGLTGDSVQEYEMFVEGDLGAYVECHIRPNNDGTGGNYRTSVEHYFGNVYHDKGTQSRVGHPILSGGWAEAGRVQGRIRFHAPSGSKRVAVCEIVQDASSGTYFSRCVNTWTNTADEITSLVGVFSGTTTFTGTASLYKVV